MHLLKSQGNCVCNFSESGSRASKALALSVAAAKGTPNFLVLSCPSVRDGREAADGYSQQMSPAVHLPDINKYYEYSWYLETGI